MIGRSGSPNAPPSDASLPRAEGENRRGKLLQAVVALCDDHQIPYCILHGHKDFPSRVVSDVDCIVPAAFLPGPIAALLHDNRQRLEATLVQWIQHEATANYFVLAMAGQTSPCEFLAVDISSDYRGDGRVFYPGNEMLASRRLERGFWVPAPALEFGCYLIKKITKAALTEEHDGRLTELYHDDPHGCARQVARFWRGSSVPLICEVAASGEWDRVRNEIGALRRQLLRPSSVSELSSSIRYWAADSRRRVQRWRVPTGLHVVMLGVDGSGKSTTMADLAGAMAPAFRRVSSHHLAPGLARRRAPPPTTEPHRLPPRSLIGSLAKALYWLVDYSLGYWIRVRPALARSTLVLFDRYLVDALVDPRRYRYAGPASLLRLLWRVVPKPDLLLLLDAPAETTQARKREVPAGETGRQRQAYLALAGQLRYARVIDAAPPRSAVLIQACNAVLEFMNDRTMRRLGENGKTRSGGARDRSQPRPHPVGPSEGRSTG